MIQADEALASCGDPRGYLELLPYVLDPHGPGSRLSVRRDARTRTARKRKRVEGVYYTPADVAAYMIQECFKGLGGDKPRTVFDPACGTGVFLRAALRALKEAYPDQSVRSLAESVIYGTDIDPWALDAAAFVLLADCLADREESENSPLLLWHRLRLNLACVDAIRLDPPRREGNLVTAAKSHVVDALRSGRLPASDETILDASDERVRLSQIFGSLPSGRFVVVGNPPYSAVENRDDFAILKKLFASLEGGVTQASEIYPLFVEQMVRLAPGAPVAGTLVLPLSLASNVGKQFVQTRSLIENTLGKWQFAFFDREPHALFGEDVKTRNTILIWHRHKQERESLVESGPLRKWRGDDRAAMFSSIRFTRVLRPISAGIPKIEGAFQAHAFELLAGRSDRLDHLCVSIRRMSLAQALKHDGHTVFVGATAYNFLNVFMKPPSGILLAASALSEHPLHALDFPTKEDALAAFAVLSSHIAYWWWQVNHDGFHVTRRFVVELPFGTEAMSGTSRVALAARGEQLWSLMRTEPIISVNRGRTSLAYSPNSFEDKRRESDQVLAKSAGLESEFVIEVQRFTNHMVKAESCAVLNTYHCEGE